MHPRGGRLRHLLTQPQLTFAGATDAAGVIEES
jgi:hypothetical protein